MQSCETYFEFYCVAGQVRVSAIDEKTGIEVQVIAPANLDENSMKRAAQAKLDKRLADLSEVEDSAAPQSWRDNNGRGILV